MINSFLIVKCFYSKSTFNEKLDKILWNLNFEGWMWVLRENVHCMTYVTYLHQWSVNNSTNNKVVQRVILPYSTSLIHKLRFHFLCDVRWKLPLEAFSSRIFYSNLQSPFFIILLQWQISFWHSVWTALWFHWVHKYDVQRSEMWKCLKNKRYKHS